MTETTFAQRLEAFQALYKSLLSIAEQYPPALQTQVGICGDWSAKEILAHINGWLVEALRRYPRYAKGTGKIDYNVDAFNAVSIRVRAGKDFEQILYETDELVTQFITMAAALPESYTERDSRYAEWLETLSQKAETHTRQLGEFLEAHS